MKKNVFALVLVIALALSSPVIKNFSAAKHVISWGLGHNSMEKKPTPPDYAETMLANNNGIYVADTQDKKVYFTFDLGYESGYTNEVLDILKENNIKAVFFLCGHYLNETELVGRMIEEGHCIGNHTNKHKDLPTLSEEAAKKDITEFTELFNSKYTAPIKYFRPPGGRICETTLRLANEQGLKTLMWSNAIKDWEKAPINAESCTKKIMGRIHPGSIMLFHIANSGTPKMLRLLITQLAEKGYNVADAHEL